MGTQAEDCSAKCTVLVFKALAASGCRLDVAVPEGVTYSLGFNAPFAAAARRRTRGRRPHEGIHMRAGGGPCEAR